MESYNFYASGLVKKVWVHHINSYAVVLSKVSRNKWDVVFWLIADLLKGINQYNGLIHFAGFTPNFFG